MKYVLAAVLALTLSVGAASATYALPCKSGINDSCEIKPELSREAKAWIAFLAA